MFYISFILIVLFDQLTKYLALSHLASVDTIPIIPNFFHFTLVYNKGVAFGLFREHPTFLFVLITVSLIVLILWSQSLMKSSRILKWSMCMILGGALGNWIDRLRFGAVIDFLDFRVWPVFNVADSCITIGVLLYFAALFKKTRKTQASSS